MTIRLKSVCDRLEMGSWKSVNRRLYEHRQTKCCHAKADPFTRGCLKKNYALMKSKFGHPKTLRLRSSRQFGNNRIKGLNLGAGGDILPN